MCNCPSDRHDDKMRLFYALKNEEALRTNEHTRAERLKNENVRLRATVISLVEGIKADGSVGGFAPDTWKAYGHLREVFGI